MLGSVSSLTHPFSSPFRPSGDPLSPEDHVVNRLICALALLSMAGGAAAGAAKRAGDFSLLDQKGYFHQMSYYDDHKVVALLTQSNGSKGT